MMSKSLVVIVCAVLAVLGLTTTATAAPRHDTAKDYCIYHVDSQTMTCYSTARELEERMTINAQYTWAAFYDWINYNTNGAYFYIVADYQCTSTYNDIDAQNLDLGSWRNRISSVLTYFPGHPNSQCDVKFWDGINLTGDSSVWISTCAHLANCTSENWYDRADSVRIS